MINYHQQQKRIIDSSLIGSKDTKNNETTEASPKASRPRLYSADFYSLCEYADYIFQEHVISILSQRIFSTVTAKSV